MGSPSITRAQELARGGLLTIDSLREAGLDPRMAQRMVRAGSWQRPAHGIYLPYDRRPTGLELGRVAAELAGTRVVISGLVTLHELGLRWLPDTDRVVALVRPELRTPSSGSVTLRRTKDFAALGSWRRDGLELAMPARAVVDAAWELDHLRDVRGVVLGAVTDRWAGVDELRAVLATTQRNGSGLCRRALTDSARGCASPPEAELVDELVGCGVPFYVNPDLLLHGRLLGSPDIWLPGLGTGGEVESQERHGSDEDTETTYDRHERITDAGIELVHLSVRRIRRSVREAAQHLLSRADERRRRGLGDPAGLLVVPRGPLLR